MTRQICFYHRSDLDGQCCGAIYAKAHEGKEFTLYPIDYGDPFPWEEIKGAEVTMMDWSLQPWVDFQDMAYEAQSVTWIDHHKSAIDTWKQRGFLTGSCVTTVLDTKKAACELAWEHFFPDTPMPLAVKLLGRYDVWDHSDDRVLPFQYSKKMYDLDPKNGADRLFWFHFLGANSSLFIGPELEKGSYLLRYQEKQDAAAVEGSWFPLCFDRLWWQACNRLGKGSTFFKSIWNPQQFAGMLAFGWDGQKKKWQVGLYTDHEDIDCGVIAKRYGGGGHPGAAGFLCEELPFELRSER